MELNSGDTAWVLASTAMVLLMTPGLAFFYGGMTKAKSTLNMMMMSFITICIVSVLWVVYGFSLAFTDSGNGFIGNITKSGLGTAVNELTNNGGVYGIPLLAFAGFQLMFAVITPALISGAIADRTKFLTWGVFVAIWVTIVYFPVAHWVFYFGNKAADGTVTGAGWLAARGVEDFAGGTAVHINAGAAGLALAIVLGKRIGFKKNPTRPHNLPLVLMGAGLLWFGWFGFNAGSALGANGTAALALMNTQVATAAALGGWLLVEKIRDGHPTSLGAASGAVAGLVAITPACAFIAPWAAVVLGVIAGMVCSLAVGLKYSLQALGAFSVLAYSFVVTMILGFLLEKTLGFRVSRDDELEGIDLTEHAETAYEFEGLSGGGLGGHSTSVLKEKLAVKADQEVSA